MYSVLFTSCVALCLCLVLTPAVRRLALRWGFVDLPDGVRKLHARPIPRIGGVAIALSYLAAFGILLLTPLQAGRVIERALPLVGSLLPAAGLVFAIGLADDLRGLKPLTKLAGQAAAAGLAAAAGVRISSIAGCALPEWLCVPLTILWIVACANAFNLIDGVDGLAAGAGLLAALTAFFAAVLDGNISLALATLPLAGCLLGFLRYNFNPASIFLGDSGSLLIGFLLGCYAVIWSQKSATIVGMTAPVIALSVPLIDTGLAIARRLLRGQPVFGADRGHVHHRLLDRGFTPRRVALLLYGACGVAAAFSLLQSIAWGQYAGLVILVFLGLVCCGVHLLGYDEFQVARQLLAEGQFQRLLESRLSLKNMADALAGASSLDACWHVVRNRARAFGFDSIELHIAGARYGDGVITGRAGTHWHLFVPLNGSGHVVLGRGFQSPIHSPAIAGFVTTLRAGLEAKIEELGAGRAAPVQLPGSDSLARLVEHIHLSQPAPAANSPGKQPAPA